MLHTWSLRQRHATCNRTERFSSLFWHSELHTKSYWKTVCCLAPHIKWIKSLNYHRRGFQTLSNWCAVESQYGKKSHSWEDGSRFATEGIPHPVQNDSRLSNKEEPTRCNNNLLIYKISSTCFRQFFCPSSGAWDWDFYSIWYPVVVVGR